MIAAVLGEGGCSSCDSLPERWSPSISRSEGTEVCRSCEVDALGICSQNSSNSSDAEDGSDVRVRGETARKTSANVQLDHTRQIHSRFSLIVFFFFLGTKTRYLIASHFL